MESSNAPAAPASSPLGQVVSSDNDTGNHLLPPDDVFTLLDAEAAVPCVIFQPRSSCDTSEVTAQLTRKSSFDVVHSHQRRCWVVPPAAERLPDTALDPHGDPVPRATGATAPQRPHSAVNRARPSSAGGRSTRVQATPRGRSGTPAKGAARAGIGASSVSTGSTNSTRGTTGLLSSSLQVQPQRSLGEHLPGECVKKEIFWLMAAGPRGHLDVKVAVLSGLRVTVAAFQCLAAAMRRLVAPIQTKRQPGVRGLPQEILLQQCLRRMAKRIFGQSSSRANCCC